MFFLSTHGCRYRELLKQGSNSVHFVYLKCSKELLQKRLLHRKHHYMQVDMLDSQLDALEEPSIKDYWVHVFNVTQATSVDEIIGYIFDLFAF